MKMPVLYSNVVVIRQALKVFFVVEKIKHHVTHEYITKAACGKYKALIQELKKKQTKECF